MEIPKFYKKNKGGFNQLIILQCSGCDKLLTDDLSWHCSDNEEYDKFCEDNNVGECFTLDCNCKLMTPFDNCHCEFDWWCSECLKEKNNEILEQLKLEKDNIFDFHHNQETNELDCRIELKIKYDKICEKIKQMENK